MHIIIKILTTLIIGIKEYFSEKVVEKLIKGWIGDKFEDFAIRTLWFWLLVFLVLEGFIGWNSLQQSGWLVHPLVNIAYIGTFSIITIVSMWALWLLSDVVYLHYREIKEKPHRNYQIYKMDMFFIYDEQNNIKYINRSWSEVTKDSVDKFSHTFVWTGTKFGRPKAYLIDKHALRIKSEPLKTRIHELPEGIGWARVEVVLPTCLSKYDGEGNKNTFGIELIWDFKDQAKDAKPILQVSVDKYLYNLEKVIYDLRVEVPKELVASFDEDNNPIYRRFTKFNKSTATGEVKIMRFEQENGKYVAHWKLDNREQKVQHGLIYGLFWDIKGRAKKILDKEL